MQPGGTGTTGGCDASRVLRNGDARDAELGADAGEDVEGPVELVRCVRR